MPLTRAIVVCLALLLVAACQREAPKAEHVLVWQPVATWSADGNLQTESFTSQTGTFKFTWDAQDTGAAPGHMLIVLHSAVSGRPLVEAVKHTGSGKGEIFVNEDPREFYVVIDAEGLHWTLTVDEGISMILTPTNR